MKKILSILTISIIVSISFTSCEKDDNNNNSSSTSTPVFKNPIDTLDGVYVSTHKTGATTYVNFTTEIKASEEIKNEFTYNNLAPFNRLINARLENNNIIIDTIRDSAIINNCMSYYYLTGGGTLIDSNMNISLNTNYSGSNALYWGRNDYSINLNQ